MERSSRGRRSGQTIKTEEACYSSGYSGEGGANTSQALQMQGINMYKLDYSVLAILLFPRNISLTFTHLLLHLLAMRFLPLNRNQLSLSQTNFINSASFPQTGKPVI